MEVNQQKTVEEQRQIAIQNAKQEAATLVKQVETRIVNYEADFVVMQPDCIPQEVYHKVLTKDLVSFGVDVMGAIFAAAVFSLSEESQEGICGRMVDITPGSLSFDSPIEQARIDELATLLDNYGYSLYAQFCFEADRENIGFWNLGARLKGTSKA